ncbi:MAG: cytochrome c biogenesis protein CcsA [Bacteroidota bacterium]
MTVLGNWLVLFGLVSAAGSATLYFHAALRQKTPGILPRALLGTSVLGIVAASVALLLLLLSHDYSNGYVYGYSDSSLPLHFLLSSFYAGQEGSFLFWVLCSGIFALVLWRYTKKEKNEAWVMSVYMAVYAALLVLVVVKSPFRFLWEMYPDAPVGFLPADGRGLNPLLQNFWMVIHPPVLFVGFAGMAVPFSYAIAGLWRREYTSLTTQAFPWVLSVVALLGLGIMLGAYWAYGVLGWGGYWGWDPVENSSLIPWLTAIALVHTLAAQKRTSRYVRTNFFLAIVSFFFVIYSTFLTRSGILGDASVHAFTAAGATVYWMLLVSLAAIAIAGTVMLALRWREMEAPETSRSFLTRETALGAGALVLLLSAAVILFGTSLPIFSNSSVEPAFYDTTNLPIAILMAFLVGFSLTMQWEFPDGRDTLRRSWKALAVSLVITLVLVFAGMRDVVMAIFAFSAIFTLFVNVEIGLKVAKGDPLYLGGKLAHIGLALFFLGVISTGRFSSSQQVVLPLNAPRDVLGHRMTYVGHSPLADGKHGFTVEVERGDRKFQMVPVMFDAGEQGVMRNPDILSFLTHDVYISPLSLERGDDTHGGREVHTIAKGQTVSVGDVKVTFTGFDMNQHGMATGEMTIGSVLKLERETESETITPMMVHRPDGEVQHRDAKSRLLNAGIQLMSMNVGGGGSHSTITVGVLRPGDSPSQEEALIVEASIKPFINLLWAGTGLMMIGFVLSILKRSKEA